MRQLVLLHFLPDFDTAKWVLYEEMDYYAEKTTVDKNANLSVIRCCVQIVATFTFCTFDDKAFPSIE